MINNVQLRDAVETDLQIFYEQQLDPEAIQMAAFLSIPKQGCVPDTLDQDHA